VKHRASTKFWAIYEKLPRHIRELADKNFELMKADPRHPSLHLKRIGELWSVRIGEQYRALGLDDETGGIFWIWI